MMCNAKLKQIQSGFSPRRAVVLPQEAPSSTSRFHTRAHQFTVASALEMHAG